MVDAPSGLERYASFLLPNAVIEEISPYQMTNVWQIYVEDETVSQVEEWFREFARTSPYLEVHSFSEILEMKKEEMRMTEQICYAFLGMLGMVGIMNLINTMITSIYTRKREIGITQAIGLSEKQMLLMLQMEGMMNIRVYHFPLFEIRLPQSH